tara:strand:+ start:5015 stop:5659 length:645 start_codon:yes stop_codon:yes gene_type:complete
MALTDFFSGSYNPSQSQFLDYFAGTLTFLGYTFWVLIGLGIMWFFWYTSKYNIKVHMYDAVGDKNKMLRFLGKRRATIQVKEGVSKMKMFLSKQSFEAPSPEDYLLSAKGKILNLLKEGTQLKPLRISINPGHATVSEQDVKFWASQTMNVIAKKYTELNWFQKYGAYAVFIFGMLVLGWMFYVMLGLVDDNLAKVMSVADKVATATGQKIAGP